jgi:hypothetical protein
VKKILVIFFFFSSSHSQNLSRFETNYQKNCFVNFFEAIKTKKKATYDSIQAQQKTLTALVTATGSALSKQTDQPNDHPAKSQP